MGRLDVVRETAKEALRREVAPIKAAAQHRLNADPRRGQFDTWVEDEKARERKEMLNKAKRMVPGIDTDFSWIGAAKAEMRNAKSEAGKKLRGMFVKPEKPVRVPPLKVGEMEAAPKAISDAMKRRKQALSGAE